MAERELGAAVRSVQGQNHIADYLPHAVTFADFVEKLLDEKYSPEERLQLNKIFMNRKEALKPRRKNNKSSRKTILTILANEYEKFVFDTMKRKMEERNAKVLFDVDQQNENKNY